MRHLWLLARDLLGLRMQPVRPIEEHLRAAADWLLRAQAATADDGVAHSYDVRAGKWLASYPETTGYIIPTLYDYARHFDAPACADAARRMALWEVAEQLPDGGVRAGTMDAEVVVPTVFNTGQVLFGLARAVTETRDERVMTALVRAADWLVAAQDADGCWRRFQSPFTTTRTAAYNTRSAFGLTRTYAVAPDRKYLDAADRNVAWALSTARPNGWLPGNCLTENVDDSALTHTIAYSIRGIFEVGLAVAKPHYVERALAMAKAVATQQNDDGSLPAYYSPEWKRHARWTCVTGNSQMAINWLRLARETGETGFVENARRANRFNMSIQDLTHADPAIRGALKGSHPVNGGYMTWRFPNWAAKFFMDALMLERLNDRVDDIG